MGTHSVTHIRHHHPHTHLFYYLSDTCLHHLHTYKDIQTLLKPTWRRVYSCFPNHKSITSRFYLLLAAINYDFPLEWCNNASAVLFLNQSNKRNPRKVYWISLEGFGVLNESFNSWNYKMRFFVFVGAKLWAEINSTDQNDRNRAGGRENPSKAVCVLQLQTVCCPQPHGIDVITSAQFSGTMNHRCQIMTQLCE